MPAPAFTLEGLRFRYRGAERDALAGVDLALEEGRVLAVLGATGAGKTTLARALAGIVPGFLRGAFSGAVRGVDGRDVALVFEDFESQLFTTEVALEVAFGPEGRGCPREEIERRVRAALERTGLSGFEGRSPATLSGGEKQRLAVAAALALDPRILVLDEALTDIDPEGKKDLARMLRELRAAGKTIVLVEHETEELSSADRAVVLGDGRVAREGPAHEVFADAAFLASHGVRAPEIPQLFGRLGLDPRKAPIDDDGAAAEMLRAAGVEVDREAVAGLGPSSSATQGTGTGTGTEAAMLGATGLRHLYEGRETPALDGVDIEIRRGEFMAILGANGSGKSTLARVLNGLLVPAEGTVRGADPRAIGFVFQNPDHQIFCASVEEEVAFGPRNHGIPEAEVRARVREALEATGLAGAERRDPFAMPRSDRQRLAVASVLAMKTPAIILDEPTTGLDHRDQLGMMRLLARLNGAGHTIIAITHHVWVALEHADRLVVMARGKKLADGPVRTVIQDTGALESARVRLPPVVRTALRFGVPARSLEEAARCLRGPLSAGGR